MAPAVSLTGQQCPRPSGVQFGSRCPANTVTEHLSHREQADVQPGTCRGQVCTASRVSKSVFGEPVGKMESSRFSVSREIKTGVSIFLPTLPLPLALNISPGVTFRVSAFWVSCFHGLFWETLMVTVFTSVYSAKAYSPSSLPLPDILKPPKGACA